MFELHCGVQAWSRKCRIRLFVPFVAAVLRAQVGQKQAKVKHYMDKCHGAQSPQFQRGSYVRVKKPIIIKTGHLQYMRPLQVVAQRSPATFGLSDGKVWNAIH